MLEVQSRTVKKIRSSFAHFGHVKVLMKRLDGFMEHDPQGEAEHILVLGESGVGKTRLLQQFALKHPRTEHVEFTEVPVLYVPIPAKCSVRKLAGCVLQALGSNYWDRGNEEARTFQVKTLLKTCRVRVVILDEANHLVDRGQEATHYYVGDWLKEVADAAGIPFVLAGTLRAATLLDTNEQLRSRFREPLVVRPFGMATEVELAASQRALRVFGEFLAGLDALDIAHRDNARKILFATGGRLREICRLLTRAVTLARGEPQPRLGMPELEQAFREAIFPGAPAKRNPFDAAFDGSPLIKPKEPFAPGRS